MKKKFLTILAASAMAAAMSTTAFAYGWQQTADGKYWFGIFQDNSSWCADGWYVDSNKYYYFDENGYLLTNTTTPDGEQVNEKGEWVKDGVVQTSTGTLPEKIAARKAVYADYKLNPNMYTDQNGWQTAENGQKRYAANKHWCTGWWWIMGSGEELNRYYFDENGYLLTNTTTPDGSQVNGEGQCVKDGVVQSQHPLRPMNAMRDESMQTDIEDLTDHAMAYKGSGASLSKEEADSRITYALSHRSEAAGWQTASNGRSWYAIDKDASICWNGYLWIWNPDVEALNLYFFDNDGYLETGKTVRGSLTANSDGEILNGIDGNAAVFHPFSDRNKFWKMDEIESIRDDINQYNKNREYRRRQNPLKNITITLRRRR